MSPRMRKVAKYGGYVAYAVAVCVATIYIFFPYDRLKKMVAARLDSDGRYDVTIEEVGPAFPVGLTVTGIRIVSPPEKPDEKPGIVDIDRLQVTVGLFSLLSDTKEIDLEVDALGGHISAQVETQGKARKIAVQFEGVSMAKLPGIAKAISLPMTGALHGKGYIDIPEQGLRRSKGKLSIQCKSCTLGDGKTKVKIDFRPKHKRKRPNPMADEGVTLPRVRLGRFAGDIVIENGKATFRQFEALSPDGEAILMGTITLREPFAFSNVDAYFKFKFAPELKKKEQKWQAIESSLGRGKRADGYIGFAIRGRLKDPPKFKPRRYSAVERLYKNSRGGRGVRDRSRRNRRTRGRDRRRRGLERKRDPRRNRK